MGTPYVGPTPSATTDIVNKAYADSLSGGGATTISAVVKLDSKDQATIANANVTANSNIVVTPGNCLNTDENSYDMDPIVWSVVSKTAGSFVVNAQHVEPYHQFNGKFSINYTINTKSAISVPTLTGFAYTDVGTPTGKSITLKPSHTSTAFGGFTTRPNGGDFLVLVIYSIDASPTYVQPSGFVGWTPYDTGNLGNVGIIDVYTRVAGGSTGSPTTDTSYVLNSDLANWEGFINCFAFTGATAIDAYGTAPSSGLKPTTPSITTTTAYTTVITGLFESVTPTSIKQTHGTTARSILSFGATESLSSYAYITATEDRFTAGATGTRTFTLTTDSATSPSTDGFAIAVK